MGARYYTNVPTQEVINRVIVHLLVKLGYIKGNNRTCERR
jgi:hypothetical protein